MNPGSLVYVTTPGILWSFHGDEPVIIRESNKGDLLLVIGGPPVLPSLDEKVDSYLQILTPLGEVGWIHGGYVRVVHPAVITPVSGHQLPR